MPESLQTSNKGRIRVLIASSRIAIIRGLTDILGRAPGVSTVSSTRSLSELYEIAVRLQPDVVLVDLLWHHDESSVGPLLSLYGFGCLAYGDREDLAASSGWLDSGGAGYIPKSASDAELIKAVRSVASGKTFIPPIAKKHSAPAKKSSTSLSKRESDVVTLVAMGYSGAMIAERLQISPKTVDTYRLRIARKSGLRSRQDLVRFAFKNGMVDVSEPARKARAA